MTILMKRILKVTFWVLFIAFDIIGLMALSNVLQNGEYTVDTRKFDTVVEWGDEINFDGIKIIDNRVFGLVETTLTDDMIVSVTDTSTAGEKRVVFEHNNQRFVVVFTVHYRVDFLVNGEIIDTQRVVSADELVFPTPTPKHGYEFAYWDYDFSLGINGNLQVNAVFSELKFPKVTDLTATYGDTLGDLTLPSNNRGRWEFLDPATTPVGDAGRHTFLIGYVFDGQDSYYEYDSVEVNVQKKHLDFHIDSESFPYDTKSHYPSYTLDVDGLEVISTGSAQILPGRYDYSFEIIDPNYSGEYIGSFEITRPNVTVTVSSATMTYLEQVPEFTYTVEGFDNTDNILGITVNVPTTVSKAGEYEIGIEWTDENVNITVVTGTLTVLKADRPVNAPTLGTATYEDKLSDVEFVGNYLGKWEWENPDLVIDSMSGITAWAVFTHNDSSLNPVRMQLTVTDIQKKELTINIIGSKFTYDPDKGYTLIYEIVGSIYPHVYAELTVYGNSAETEVGKYARTLYISDDRYTATASHYLEIEQATPDTDFIKLYERDWSEGLKLGSITLPTGYAWDDPDKIITAGEHEVYMTFTPEDTHNYKTVTEKITVKVARVEPEIDGIRDTYDKNYDTTKIDIKNSGIKALYTDGILSITYYKDGVEVDEILNAGTYKVVISVTQGTNYLERTVEKTVVISPRANPEAVSTSQSVYYNSPMSALKLPDGLEGTWTWLETEIGEVGTKTFTAVYTPDTNGNYLPCEVEVTVEVKKISLKAPQISDTQYTGEGFVYDTKLKDTDEYLVDGDIVVYAAGNYSVTFTLTDPDHYEWLGDEDEVSVSRSYNVSNALNTWKTEPKDITVEFSGDPVYMSAEATYGDKDDISIVYMLNGVVVDAPIYVGVYKVIVTAPAANYDDLVAERTIEIKKQTVPTPKAPVGGIVYTGSEQGIPLDSNLDVLYTKGAEVKGTDAGDALSVVLTLKDSDNYKWSTSEAASVTVTSEIAKHTVSYVGAPSVNKSEWTYLEEEGTATNAAVDEVSSALGITPELRFSYNGGSAVSFSELGRTNGKLNAGTYEVWSVVPGTKNWDETHSTSVTFVIHKISAYTISVSWPDAVSDVADGLYYQNLLGTPVYTVTYKGETVSLATPCTYAVSSAGFKGADTAYTFTVYPLDTINYASAGVDIGVALKTVATINLGTGYGTIEAALKAAKSGETVWVTTDITGNVYITEKNVTVPEGVTLLIPYGNVDSAEGRNMQNKATISINTSKKIYLEFAYKYPEKYFKNWVKLAEGVTLTVDGTLDISGELTGGGGGRMAGYTAGRYALLELAKDAKIQINGTVKSFGYINNMEGETTGKIEVGNGGRLYIPFVLYDFKGGTILSAIYYDVEDGYGTTPFTRFSYNNVTVDIKFCYGAKFISVHNLKANDDFHHTDGNFIGDTTDSFIQLTQPGYSYVETKYDPETMITKVGIYGGANVNSLSLTVDAGIKTVTISSNQFVFGWSWMFDITLAASEKQMKDGVTAVYNANSEFKLMPGCKLTVEKGARLEVSSLSVYDNSFYDVFHTCRYPTVYPTLSSLSGQTIGSAIFTVRGEVVAGELAGAVYTDTDGAKITVTGSTKITTYEVSNTEKETLFGQTIGGKVTARQAVTQSLRLVYVDAEGNVLDAVSAIARGADGVFYTSDSTLQAWTTDATITEYITVTLPGGVHITIDSVVITDDAGNVIGLESYDSSEGGVVKLVPDTPVLFHLNKQLFLLNNAATSYTAELYDLVVACSGTHTVRWHANATDQLYVYDVPTFKLSSDLSGKVKYYNLGLTNEAGESTTYAEIVLSVSNTVYKDGTLSVKVGGLNTSQYGYTYTGIAGTQSGGNYTITGDNSGGTDVSITLTITLTADVAGTIEVTTEYNEGTKDDSGSCVTPDTLITLADGTLVRVDSLKGDELLLVWNLETGKFDFAPIMFIDSELMAEYEVIYLYFSDGSVVKVISEHGFWDYDLNKYVYLDEFASDYIGHYFAKHNGDELVKVQLVNVEIVTELTTAWSPVTAGHLCYFVNGMLSMPGGVGGLFNIFEVDRETMTYDYEAMAKDIETYGLYTYEELNAICPLSEQMFNLAGGAYLKVSIGKGNLTEEELISMIERYSVYFE